MRRGFAVSLLALVATPWAAYTSDSDALRRATEKWHSARDETAHPEVYLRRVVAADSAFNRDPGLAMAHLSPGMRREYDGLQYLLSTTLKSQFLGLSSDALRSEWLRRYWRLKDPTPTTAENERRSEHAHRIEKALAEFSQEEPPGWDGRGRVLIMYGEPDSIIEDGADIREGAGYVPAWQQWLYFDEKWVAEFERPIPNGPWVLGRASMSLSHRPDLVRDDKRRLGYSDSDRFYADGRERQGDAFGLDEERRLMRAKGLDESLSPEVVEHEVRSDLRARELLRKRSEATIAFTEAIESGNERFVMRGKPRESIWYVFDVDVFKGPPGRMRVEVHYQFNLQDLTFQWRDSLYVARYEVEGLLLDGDVHEVAHDTYSETLEAREFGSTLEGRLLPGQLNFDVVEGQYRLAIRFLDPVSGAEGTYLTDLDVPRLDGNQLALSDIEMATKIVYADATWHERFVKNDRLVVPNPIGVYRRDKTLTSYFEIYGLELNESSTCRYKVTWSIVPRSVTRQSGWLPRSDAGAKPYVSASFEGEGATREPVEALRIDVATLSEDTYDLVLLVRDLVSGHEATTRTAFSILQ